MFDYIYTIGDKLQNFRDPMTFDDILNSGDLFDGVWDTQRLTSVLEGAVSAATQKKIERLLADRDLLFPVASDETACDEHGRPGKRSVLKAIVDRAKTKRHRLLLMASHESDGLHYLGFNDGRSVRRWVFSKDTIDSDVLAHYLNDSALEGIQALVPGCTHYPLLKNVATALLNEVQWIDAPTIVAEQVAKHWNSSEVGEDTFYLSDRTDNFLSMSHKIFQIDANWELVRLSE